MHGHGSTLPGLGAALNELSNHVIGPADSPLAKPDWTRKLACSHQRINGASAKTNAVLNFGAAEDAATLVPVVEPLALALKFLALSLDCVFKSGARGPLFRRKMLAGH